MEAEKNRVKFRNWSCRVQKLFLPGSAAPFCRVQKLCLSVSETISAGSETRFVGFRNSGFRNYFGRFQKLFGSGSEFVLHEFIASGTLGGGGWPLTECLFEQTEQTPSLSKCKFLKSTFRISEFHRISESHVSSFPPTFPVLEPRAPSFRNPRSEFPKPSPVSEANRFSFPNRTLTKWKTKCCVKTNGLPGAYIILFIFHLHYYFKQSKHFPR